MIEESTRALAPRERAVLEGLRRPATTGGAPLGAFLTFMLVLGTLLVLSPESWQTGVRSLAPVVVALVAAGLVYAKLRRAQREDPWYARVARDLAEGVASVATYRVTDATAVEELEDEGSQYYLRLVDGRVLFLAGQYLYEVEEDGRFPCTTLTLVRAPSSGIVLDIRCEGAPLAVSGRRGPFTVEDHRAGRVPEDGAVLELPFESLRGGGETA